MTYIRDDRRYMSFETRAADDPRYRGKATRPVKTLVTCYCGKTVIEAAGRPTGVTCPRECSPTA